MPGTQVVCVVITRAHPVGAAAALDPARTNRPARAAVLELERQLCEHQEIDEGFDAGVASGACALGHLEAVWDPGAIRHLESVGVGKSWHCAEIGAGTGSIAEWLRRRGGTTRHVVATDIETKFLVAISTPKC